ncbi:MAG: hypothetical protein VR76_14965 [Pseudomonas sp. BRH_c35]|nr:MAG: hypothetical protein VR76_14965 [Pseudomonas sp. BRH_c35]
MESFESLFSQAERSLSEGAELLGLISRSSRLDPGQKDRLSTAVSRLVERIALNGRLLIESLGRGDTATTQKAAVILGRHLELAQQTLPAISSRISGVLHA